ncbi:MAG TPA: hypothetical protein EYP98_21635, partial [Planctomycetes bacterium]|nr:hypothetical protein [Planctomycetota bacterium]
MAARWRASFVTTPRPRRPSSKQPRHQHPRHQQSGHQQSGHQQSGHQQPGHRSGQAGEDLACRFLQQLGYRIVARNLALRSGEIDILVRRGRSWAAIEVKARRDHPAPERCVTECQLDRIERSLRILQPTLRPRPRTLRIDIVTVRWHWTNSSEPPTADLNHFTGFRHLVVSARGLGCCHRPLSTQRRFARYSCTSRRLAIQAELTQPQFMVTLAEQMIPRRKLLLLFSEMLLFVAVIIIGTSAPPFSTHTFLLLEPSEDLLRGLATSLTIAIICQASLSYNDLYDWKIAQNRANLANRLVYSYGYALVMLGFLALVAGPLFYLPGIDNLNDETWKLIVLVGIAFVLVFCFRHAFHWFFYKWRFGERVIVLGSSQEALILSRMIQDNPMAGFELLGIIEEHGQPQLESRDNDPPLAGTLEDLHAKCRAEGISRVI